MVVLMCSHVCQRYISKFRVIKVKNLLLERQRLCMDSFVECSTQLALEVIHVSIRHREYMAKRSIYNL